MSPMTLTELLAPIRERALKRQSSYYAQTQRQRSIDVENLIEVVEILAEGYDHIEPHNDDEIQAVKETFAQAARVLEKGEG